MARRAAVIGSGGQLGAELVRELRRRGYETVGWDRHQLDITAILHAKTNAMHRNDCDRFVG